MDKDEILERSRKEHKDRDFVEDEALAQASKIAITVGMIVCGLLTIIQAYAQHRVDYGAWTLIYSIISTIDWVKFAKLRRRLNLVGGLIYLVGAIFFFILYLRDILGVS